MATSMSCSITRTVIARSSCLDEPDHPGGLGRGKARRRFVQEQDGRAGDQRHGDLHLAHFPIGEVPDRFVRLVRDPQPFQDGLACLEVAPLPGQGKSIPNLVRSSPIAAMTRFSSHGHRRKEGGDLEGPAEAHRRPPVGRQVGDVLAEHLHLPRRDRVDPADQAEERRLPGAVGADQGPPLPLLHAQGHVADRFESPEPFRQADAFQGRLICRSLSFRCHQLFPRCCRRFHSPMIPIGAYLAHRMYTSAMIISQRSV